MFRKSLFNCNILLNNIAFRRNIKEQFSQNNVPFCYNFVKFLATSPNSGTVNYDQFRNAIQNKKVYIVDVRDPEELKENGTLPRSINIPLKELQSALDNLSEDQFLRKYGEKKPDKNAEIIFSCMSGVRSQKAQQKASELGYKNAKTYKGGWLEWSEKQQQ